MSSLESGERTVPKKQEPTQWNTSLYRYICCVPFVKNKRVLDLGCGTGYGTSYLASSARSIVGIDNSIDSINYANSQYAKKNLSFRSMDLKRLDFPDKFFDVVIAIEVIEHVKEQDDCIKEMARVLNDDGLLIITSPNQEEHPGLLFNEFHEHEMNYVEFSDLLKKYFSNVRIFGYGFFIGLYLVPFSLKKPLELTLDFSLLEQSKFNHPFFFALCSKNQPLDHEFNKLAPFSFDRTIYVDYLERTKNGLLEDYAQKLFPDYVRYLIDTNNFKLAKPLVEVLYNEFRNSPQWSYYLGYCYHMERNFKKAIELYSLSLELGFTEFWVRYNRGSAYIEFGYLQEAKVDLLKAALLNPLHPGTSTLLKTVEKMLKQP